MPKRVSGVSALAASLLTMLVLAGPVNSLPVTKCDHHCRSIHHKRKVVRPWNAKILRIAWCESRRRWKLNTGNGFYGGLQFSADTWHRAGGIGYPHQHTKLEQKYRAVRWHDKIGTWVTTAGWPHCGYA